MSRSKDKGADCTERWLPVVGYEGLYAVSDLGRIKRVPHLVERRNRFGPFAYVVSERLLSKRIKRNGYEQVNLYKDGIMRSLLVHRLVMSAFVGPSRLEVNHKNEIKTDNRLSNLEYVTSSENARYSSARGVESFDLKTGEVFKRYEAEIDVRADGFDVGAVNNCCLKKPRFRSHKGFGWRFMDEQG